MKKTEEFKVLGIITLTLVLLLAFCLSTSDVLAFLLLGLIGALLGLVYARYIEKDLPVDERSEKISLIATRNGFLAVILLLTFDAVISHLYPSLATITDTSLIAWGLGVFAYITTYMFGIKGA